MKTILAGIAFTLLSQPFALSQACVPSLNQGCMPNVPVLLEPGKSNNANWARNRAFQEIGTIFPVTVPVPFFNTNSLNKVILCDQQMGATADVQINAAIAALPPSGGTVDCRGYGATLQTIAATVNVGIANKTATMLVDRTTSFTCTIVNNTPCWKVFGASSIIGMGTVT